MKAVIFGSFISVDFKLVPLLKGLKIGKILTELVEKQELTINVPKCATKSHQMTRSIHRDEYRLPSDVEAEDIEGQEGFIFSRQIPVPQSLRRCVQTIDCLGIKIRHSLNFNVQLHNPDGHVSEVSFYVKPPPPRLTDPSSTLHYQSIFFFLRIYPSMIIII